jgi:hypothetical protein
MPKCHGGDRSSKAIFHSSGATSKTNTSKKLAPISQTRTLWVTHTITVIWKEFFSMWEQCNIQVHDHDKATRTLANQRRLATEFKHIQAQRSKVLHTDRRPRHIHWYQR